MKSYKKYLKFIIWGEITISIVLSSIRQISFHFLSINIKHTVSEYSAWLVQPFRLISLIIIIFILSQVDLSKLFKNHKIVLITLLFLILIEPIGINSNYFFLHIRGIIKYIIYFLVYLLYIREIDLETKNGKLLSVDVPKPVVYLFYSVLAVNFIFFILHPVSVIRDFLGFNYAIKRGFIIGHGNEEGNLMMTILPFILIDNKMFSLKNIVTFIFILILLVVNGSRASLIIFLITTFIFYFQKEKNIVFKSIVFLLIALFVLNFEAIFLERFKNIYENFNIYNILYNTSSPNEQGSFFYRIYILWLPAIFYTIKNNIYFGVGGGISTIFEKEHVFMLHNRFETMGTSFHNTFIFFFSAFGLIGLVLYVILILNLFVKSVKYFVKYKNNKNFVAIFASLVGYILWSNISNSNINIGYIYLLLVSLYLYKLTKKVQLQQ